MAAMQEPPTPETPPWINDWAAEAFGSSSNSKRTQIISSLCVWICDDQAIDTVDEILHLLDDEASMIEIHTNRLGGLGILRRQLDKWKTEKSLSSTGTDNTNTTSTSSTAQSSSSQVASNTRTGQPPRQLSATEMEAGKERDETLKNLQMKMFYKRKASRVNNLALEDEKIATPIKKPKIDESGEPAIDANVKQ